MWWLLAWVVVGLLLALALGALAGRRRRVRPEPQWCGRPEGHDGPHAPRPLPTDG